MNSKHQCPDCGAVIHWTCGGEPGSKGNAYCANSPGATRIWSTGEEHLLKVCEWQGQCVRKEDGSIDIYYYTWLRKSA